MKILINYHNNPQKSKIQRNKKRYKISEIFLDKQIMGKMPEWDLEHGPILSYAKPGRNTCSLWNSTHNAMTWTSSHMSLTSYTT
jgi:hypothetical protein